MVVGPEAPLVAGVADAVRAAGIACFGPSAAAARIEGSKAYAKEVMAAAGVPTAAARTAQTEAEVEAALDAFGPPYVVKDDGLAAGKGVLVTEDRAAARAHAWPAAEWSSRSTWTGRRSACSRSPTAAPCVPCNRPRTSSGSATATLVPNTGGMGAYTPLPWAPDDLVQQVTADVLQPTVDELARRGTPFVGLLYAGLALTVAWGAGGRVQRPVRRPGDPAAADPADHPARRAAVRRGDRQPG